MLMTRSGSLEKDFQFWEKFSLFWNFFVKILILAFQDFEYWGQDWWSWGQDQESFGDKKSKSDAFFNEIYVINNLKIKKTKLKCDVKTQHTFT